MELSIQPPSCVDGVIRVNGCPFSLGHERFQIQISLVLPSIFILDPCLHGWIVIEIDSEWLIGVLLAVDYELASSWMWFTTDCALIDKVIVVVGKFSLAFYLAPIELAIIDNLVLDIVEDTIAVRNSIKATFIENFASSIQNSLPFWTVILIPFA